MRVHHELTRCCSSLLNRSERDLLMPATPRPTAAAVSAPLLTWSRTFPATPDQVPQTRCFLAGILDGCEAAEDALLCLSELASNAILHSRSAGPGGRFAVRVSQAPGWLKVEVTDEGGPWALRPASGVHGRGLDIVKALAAGVHISDPGIDSAARTVSFEMSTR